MAELPPPLQTLKLALGKLPGIGPRSAERLALHIVQSDALWVKDLAEALLSAREKIRFCRECGSLTESQPCAICQDPLREDGLLCVVARPVDVISLEKAAVFRGRYHVLGGQISPLNGVGPEDLRIAELERRLEQGAVKELVLALGSDVEGDATNYYLAERFQADSRRITRLAHGLPVGGGLEFADDLTIGRALEGRRAIEVGSDET